MNHKKYLIMIDYGSYEGWHIHGEADDWKQAIVLWKEAMGLSNQRDCLILENLPLTITTSKLAL